MSKSTVSLRNPLVILTVVLLLVLVVVFNLLTFKPEWLSFGNTDQSSHEADLFGELDQANDVIADEKLTRQQQADQDLVNNRWQAASAGAGRDPFLNMHQKTRSPQESQSKQSIKKNNEQKSIPLMCTTIMLGGSKPTAMINGQAYHLYQRVGQYSIVAIEDNGVWLSHWGRKQFLPVGKTDCEVDVFPAITRLSEDEEDGRTKMDETEK